MTGEMPHILLVPGVLAFNTLGRRRDILDLQMPLSAVFSHCPLSN